jgi:hypothetical protein
MIDNDCKYRKKGLCLWLSQKHNRKIAVPQSICSKCHGDPENCSIVQKINGKCCGRTANILKGFGRLVWERVTKGKPDEETTKRAEVCAACEHRTFLNVSQWAISAVQSGDLPVNHEPGDWDALWCARCKCCIEAKIRVADEKCPLGKWPVSEP